VKYTNTKINESRRGRRGDIVTAANIKESQTVANHHLLPARKQAWHNNSEETWGQEKNEREREGSRS